MTKSAVFRDVTVMVSVVSAEGSSEGRGQAISQRYGRVGHCLAEVQLVAARLVAHPETDVVLLENDAVLQNQAHFEDVVDAAVRQQVQRLEPHPEIACGVTEPVPVQKGKSGKTRGGDTTKKG